MFLSSALMPIAERQMSRFHGLCDDTMDNDDEAPLRKQAYGMLKVCDWMLASMQASAYSVGFCSSCAPTALATIAFVPTAAALTPDRPGCAPFAVSS